jgi:bifunctional DNA-binding transcriptional regulator/antitoxin component of YhaV-PrlF toxin-antitoxin module
MIEIQIVSVGQEGHVPLPAAIRQRAGISAGSVVTLEARDGMIIVRTREGETELYTPERRAEFLLSNSVSTADYAAACEEVRRMGLNPDNILHDRPAGS